MLFHNVLQASITRLVALTLLAGTIASCKEASFQTSTRAGTNLTKGGDASGIPGKQTPGQMKPDKDGSESDFDKPISPDDGKPNVTPGGKIENGDLIAEGGTVDGDKPGDSIREDNDTITGPLTVMTVDGLRLDGNDSAVTLRVKKRDGTWHEVAWPRKGQQIKIESVCSGTRDVTLTFEAVLRGRTYTPSNSRCFVGKQEGSTGFTMGFEHDCSRTDYNFIDDAIAKFSCPAKNLKVDNLRWDNGINMSEWLD